MQSVNEPGSLAQVAQVIAEHDGNIDNIRMAHGRLNVVPPRRIVAALGNLYDVRTVPATSATL